MNAVAGANALVWVAVAIAVLINEAAALEGGLDVGGEIVNVLVWVAVAIGMLINEAAAAEGSFSVGLGPDEQKK
ncbi:hypothetical protein MTO96_031145 [Rhipicephalus appendiculatus]